jgi:hypothetical protein
MHNKILFKKKSIYCYYYYYFTIQKIQKIKQWLQLLLVHVSMTTPPYKPFY